MDYDRRDNVPGVNRNGDFNTLYSGSFAISSLHTYVKQLLHIRNNRNDYMKIVGPSLNETEAEDSGYNMCMQSLFQPSDYLKHYLNPYLEVFSRHTVLGIHIRSGSSANWRDPDFHITKEIIEMEFDRINEILTKSKDPLIFLASDSDELQQVIKSRFGDIVFSVSSLDKQHVGKFSTQSGLLRAVMELHLLGQCDYLLLTKPSGFGDCGRRLNAKNPPFWYFQTGDEKITF